MAAMTFPQDEFGIEQQALERRRAMAQALAGTQAPQGRMVGRIYAPPNPLEYLAAGLRQFSGRKDLEQIDKDQVSLGQRQRAQGQQELQDVIQALRGSPSFETPANEMGDEATMQSAVPGDRNRAMALALASSNPAAQQIGGTLLKESIASPKWEKFELPNKDGSKRVGYVNVNSPNPISTFQEGGVAPAKLEGVNTGGNTTFVNPYAPTAQGAPTIAHTGNPYKDLLVAGPNGVPVVNAPMVNAKKEIAKSGAANVNVNTATKPFLNELGKGAGEQVMTDFAGARSAVNTLNNLDQIERGLQNVIVGPGANTRVTMAQIGQVLGVNGKDATEQLQNTRNVMQGLARQELSAAGSMKGQGQITESERAILRKAESGQINEMTVPELKTFIAATRKTANSRIATHKSNLERLRQDPNAAGIVNYLDVQAPSSDGGSILDQADKILGGR